MKVSDYLRQQAEQCTSISRATFDLTTAGRLRELASDLQGKATELDGEAKSRLPQFARHKVLVQNGHSQS